MEVVKELCDRAGVNLEAATAFDGLDDVAAGGHVVGALKGGIDLLGADDFVLVLVGNVEALVEFLGCFFARQDPVLICVEPLKQGVFQRACGIPVTLNGDVDDAVMHDG